MNVRTRALSILLCICMMMGLMSVGVAVNASDVDPDSKPISGWNEVLTQATGGYFVDDFKSHYMTPVSVTVSEDHYAPIRSYEVFYKGKCMGQKSFELTSWVYNTTDYTSLDQFDGVCFYILVSEDNRYDLSLRIGGTVSGAYGHRINVKKGENQFVYIPWEDFISDDMSDDVLTKDLVEICTEYGVSVELVASKSNDIEQYHPTMEFTISEIYGYKTNESEDEEDYTFYIPHDETVSNIPDIFLPKDEEEVIYEYEIQEDNTVKITRYLGNDEIVEFPSTLNGLKVTALGEFIFDDRITATNYITKIVIPDSVTKIFTATFDYCSRLKNITVDSNNKAYSSENGILYNKDKTELRFYPAAKTETSFEVPSSVTAITGGAFSSQDYLERVVIPSSVTKIGDDAFMGCSNLADITIPDSLTYIGSRILYNSAYYNDKSNWTDNVLYIGNYLVDANNKELSGSLSIKEGTKIIADNALDFCEKLTAVQMPNSVTYIGAGAFFGCTALYSVTIPKSVTYIGKQAFGYYSQDGELKTSNCKILGYVGTAAEKYAKDNGMIFVTIEPQPTPIVKAPKKPAKVKKVTAKSKAKKKVIITWKRAKNAKKYTVKYSYKKNMKGAKTKTVKKLKLTLKKLKSGKKVYIQVRGINGNKKGAWSAKKSVKVK